VASLALLSARRLGIDARSLLTPASAAALEKAASAQDVSMMNPVSVQCRSSQKPFYAMLHRIDVGLVIDLEPVHTGEGAGAGVAGAGAAPCSPTSWLPRPSRASRACPAATLACSATPSSRR